MSDKYDLDAYAEELRRSQKAAEKKAYEHPAADAKAIATQTAFDECIVQFGVALIKLQEIEAPADFKARAIGTAIGNMYGDVSSSYITKGRTDLAVAMLEAFGFARDSVIEYRLTGQTPDGTAVTSAKPAQDFRRQD